MGGEHQSSARKAKGTALYRSLRVRFLFWIGIALLLTLGGSAYYVYSAQQALLEHKLSKKVEAIGRFIALISPEAIYSFDVTTLDRYISQISEDEDVRFAQILSPEGLPMTTYLPAGIQPRQFAQWNSRLDSPDGNDRGRAGTVLVRAFPIIDNDETLGQVVIGLDTTQMIQDTRRVVVDLMKIFGLIMLWLAGYIFIIFKRYVHNPVNALRKGAERIAEGDFSHQVPVFLPDELGDLTHYFNKMMKEIEIDRQALVSANQRLAGEIRQRQEANHELKKLSLAVEQSPVSVVITDLGGRVEYVNPKFCEVMGYNRHEVIGKKTHILGGEIDNPKELEQIREQLRSGNIWKSEFRSRRRNGKSCWESAVVAPIRDAGGNITHYLAVKEDITERKAFEQKLLEQATHDQLTGLPNRFLAFDRLKQMLQQSNRRQNRIGIIYIDLDNFKTVNDSMGHAIGDDLLVQVARRIRSQLRAGSTLCRLGGDEFLALVPDLRNPIEDLKAILNRIMASMHSSFDLNGNEIVVTLSLGIALFPDDGTDVGTLMSHADIAMYEAKRSQSNTFCFFTSKMNQKIQEKMTIETRLRHALEKGELHPVYHPIIRLADGALVGAETLLRWEHPEMGNIPPAEFIPISEKIGLIEPITDWLFRTVMEDAAFWKQRPDAFRLTVNVSPVYFCKKQFRRTIGTASEQAATLGMELCVEITENLFLQNSAAAIDNFQYLADQGVTTAMDDFGTGYSSLAYLKRFPLDYLKIDRIFINGLPEDNDDRLLTETIVIMGRRLGITIIAEGVETQAQLDYLRSIDVAYAQGFYIAKPMTNKAFGGYLDAFGHRHCREAKQQKTVIRQIRRI
jgi:diguanylate cyclase (GGDEF)-like protein/PAS domain S-box-containing protein